MESRKEFLSAIGEQICTAGRGASKILLSGGPGWGKTHSLRFLNSYIAKRKECLNLFLPFDQICFSPEFFVEKCRDITADALEQIGVKSSGLRTDYSSVNAIETLFGMIKSAARTSGRAPLVIVDEVAEIAVLKSYPGQGDTLKRFFELYPDSNVLMSSAFPARVLEAATSVGITVDHFPIPAAVKTVIEEIADGFNLDLDADQLRIVARLCCGSPAYIVALIKNLETRGNKGPVQAAVEELSPGGRLELLCRYHYEYLVQRSRGQGIVRQLLAAVASLQQHSSRINLTAVAEALDRSLGVTKDYIKWLLAVGILESREKEYRIKDDLLAAWIRLYKSGVVSSLSDISSEIERLAVDQAGPAPAKAAERTMRQPKKSPVAEKKKISEDVVSRKIGEETITYILYRPRGGSGLEEID